MTDELPTRLSGRARAAKFKRLPLTPADLDAAETRLRRPLPPLLRQIYSELGPGFGPGDTGLLPPPPALLPGGLFPLCDWGSGIQSAFDALSPDARIVRVDPNMPKGDVPARVPPALHFDRARRGRRRLLGGIAVAGPVALGLAGRRPAFLRRVPGRRGRRRRRRRRRRRGISPPRPNSGEPD